MWLNSHDPKWLNLKRPLTIVQALYDLSPQEDLPEWIIKTQAVLDELNKERPEDHKLKAQYLGKIVAIDVETGEYFLGDTVIEAGKKGREKYPKKVFHFIRVGFPAVHVRR